jgi:chromosome segregation ATPase
VEEINSHLTDIRKRFEELKDKRAKVGEQIENAQRALASVVERQESLRQARRERAAEAFQVISEMNKELSRLRAEGGVLDVRMRQMYSHIGKHVSFNALSDPKCAAAAKKQLALVHIMKALRRSVDLNQKLAGLGS